MPEPVPIPSPPSAAPANPGERPLLVTADPDLLEALLRLTGGAGTEAEVASYPRAARLAWNTAPLVLCGEDLAGDLLEAGVPRRRDVVLVALAPVVDEPALWRRAVHIGVDAVAVLPDDEAVVIGALSRLEQEDAGGTVVAVIGGRGGAGASVFAAAMAVAQVRAGGRALLVDGDPWGGGADLLLGGEALPGLRWRDLGGLAGRVSGRVLADALPHPYGVGVLSWDRGAPFDVPPAALLAVLDAGVRSHDLVVVDLPRRNDETVTTALARAATTLLLVPAELRAAAAASQAASLLPADRTRLVVRTGRGRNLEPELIAKTLGMPLAAVVPDDPRLAAAVDAGEPPGSGRSPLGKVADALVRRLVGPAPRSAA